MTDWPNEDWQACVTITPFHLESIGSFINNILAAYTGSLLNALDVAWPAANLAIYIPFWLAKPIVVVRLFSVNGLTALDNVDVGIYDQAGRRIVSSGSTGKLASVLQSYNIADTLIGPGLFYLAMAHDNVRNFWRVLIGTSQRCQMAGMAQEVAAFPLPATATFATIAIDYVPIFGLTARDLI